MPPDLSKITPTSPVFPAKEFQNLLPLAFAEDVGDGDITSLATIDPNAMGRARLLCKQPGVIAGLPLVEMVFRHYGANPTITFLCAEGEAKKVGDEILTIQGSLQALLGCERILLNFLQRFSGIATVVCAYAEALKGAQTKLLDTRKTLPGYRALDKYAVAIGGGDNHRKGLYDMVMVKDNHADACGSVRAAVEKVHAKYAGKYTVEAEVRSLAELATLFDAPVDIILLDNMDDRTLTEAITLARKFAPHIKLEASGNMDLNRVRRIRDFGLDFISVGALTHSVRALDISMVIVGDHD